MTDQFSRPPTDKWTDSEAAKQPLTTFQVVPAPGRSAWITAMSRQVLSSYRRDDFADPEGFLAQLGMVLERYSDDVIRTVTSPVTGIQRKCKFPPSIAEIVEACDGEVTREQMIKRYGPPIAIQRKEYKRVHWATVFVPADNAKYQAMLDKSQDPKTDQREFYFDDKRPGIWVISDWLPMRTR